MTISTAAGVIILPLQPSAIAASAHTAAPAATRPMTSAKRYGCLLLFVRSFTCNHERPGRWPSSDLAPRSPAGRSTRGEVIKQTVVERWRPLLVEMVIFGEDLVRLFDDSWMQE